MVRRDPKTGRFASGSVIETQGFTEAEAMLLEVPHKTNQALKKALRKAGQHVVKRAKQLVPRPGYPGDKPDLKPLRDTIGVEVKQGETIYAVVGPKRPAGAHGHLVEGGARHHSWGVPTGVMTKPVPFIEPASQDTKHLQHTELVDNLKKALDNIGRTTSL